MPDDPVADPARTRVAERRTGAIDADRAAEAAPLPLQPGEDLKARQDRLLDEALEESFPGSDPISPAQVASWSDPNG
jgi:hypothetical protein